MSLVSGTRLGSYEILAPLGAGGMGEVYRARDVRVDRTVALKVLPEEFFESEERRQRFEREARMLASLNHPGIAVLYSFEEVPGSPSSPSSSVSRHLLVMELVEGEDLGQRLVSGSLPLEESLSYARQIAEALEAAHEKGIVHRDLKPANVKVTHDGRVKLLDFGLAKIFEGDGDSSKRGSGDGLTESPTLTARATAAGIILGTAAYMSPEQARGKPVDKRTDVWAFGCVLYEMLTGKRAFEGETVSDTLAAVLKEDPNWAALPKETPPGVRTLLRKCLQRDSRQRLHDIGDARLELEESVSSAGASRSGSPPASSVFPFEAIPGGFRPGGSFSGGSPLRSRFLLFFPWALAAALAAAAGALALRARAPAPAPTLPHLNLSLLPPPGWSFDAIAGAPALSPDGSRLAAILRDADGKSALSVRDLDTGAVRIFPDTEGSRNPFWSPDVRSIGFYAQPSGLCVVPAGGGAIESVAPTGPGRGATWNRDGVILYSPALLLPIYRISLADRRRVPVTTLDEKRGETVHHWPQFLPDGRHFLYLVQRVDAVTRRSEAEVVVQALGSPERKLLLRMASRAVYASGHLLWVWNGDLMAQAFDPGTLTLSGEPTVLVRHVQFLADGSTGVFSVSESGLLTFAEGGTIGLAQLTLFDRTGRQVGTVGSQANIWTPHLSPDGRHVAVELIDPVNRNRDVWTFDVGGAEPPTRITFDPGEDFTPVYSPDGTRLAFASFRKGTWSIFQKRLGGGEEERAVAASAATPAGQDAFIAPRSKLLTDWSPDGTRIAFNTSTADTSDDMWTVSVADGEVSPFLVTPASERDTVFSPDGRWAAHVSAESGRPEIYVRAFPGPGGKWQVSTAGGIQPRWRSDGQELFYIAPGGWLTAVPVRTGSAFEKGTPRPLFQVRSRRTNIGQYDVFPGGQKFIVNTVVAESAGAPLTLVTGWPRRVKGP